MKKFSTFSNVEQGKEFTFKNGNTAKNVSQLYKNIKELPRKDFLHHCNEKRNEFYNWIFDEVQDVELAKEVLGCTDKKMMLGAMQAYFATITKPTPKILKKTTKKPKGISKKKASQPEPTKDLLTQALNFTNKFKRERNFRAAEASHREDLLKNLKEVYNIDR